MFLGSNVRSFKYSKLNYLRGKINLGNIYMSIVNKKYKSHTFLKIWLVFILLFYHYHLVTHPSTVI